jgi:hypothetical protein
MKNIQQVMALGGESRAEHMQAIQNQQQIFKALIKDDKDGNIVNNAASTKYEDYKKIIEDVLMVRRRTLNGVADLMANGLTQTGDISETLFGYENVSAHQDAKTEINPGSYQNNTQVFEQAFAPVPIMHQSYTVPFRQGSFDYKSSLGRDESVRKVSEAAEALLFTGSGISINFGGVLVPSYGYLTHPDRATATTSDWTDLATNGSKIIAETLAMVGTLWKDNGGVAENSVVMYVSDDYWMNMQADYSDAKGDRTFKERIEAIPQIKEVKFASALPAKTVCMVEMARRTVEWVSEQDTITVPHMKGGVLDGSVWTTYMAGAPLLKVDSEGQVGWLIGTTA